MAQSPASPEPSSFLGACLVESDSEFEKRARTIKRRALAASIILQILIVAALVLFPLLSKGENIAGRIVMPLPPYSPARAPHQPQNPGHPHTSPIHDNLFHFTSIPPHIVTRDPARNPDRDDNGLPTIPGVPTGGDSRVIGGLTPPEGNHQPPPPQPIERAKPRTVQVSSKVQEARLVRRVQPVYPPLAITIRREGRVELRAIIATDGAVQALEVISGDPLLVRSALTAVREWRYQPTLLNGEPVEVDTYITVVYTLNH